MITYKAMHQDMKCHGFQYKIGSAYAYDGDIELHSKGFHSCINGGEVFKSYPTGSRVFKVEIGGDSLEKCGVVVSSRIRILNEVTNLKSFWEEAIDQYPPSFLHMPDDIKTLGIAHKYLSKGGSAEFFPKEYLSKEVCKSLVENNPSSMHYIPKEYVDYDMCLEAVFKDGWSLHDVPEKFKTEILCKIAMLTDKHVIKYVPSDLRGKLS